MIPIYKPYLPKESLNYAHKAIDSTWVSSHGYYLDRAREKLQQYWETPYVILTNNGTAANHMMAYAMSQVYSSRMNLICPNNVYVAAWNPFLLEKYKLYPKDANIETWNIDLSKYEDHWSSLFLVVHNLGNIINVPELKKLYPEIPIIEDNCEGFGGFYNGLKTGTASECATVSFYGNKNITSGEGGAFYTKDETIYEHALGFWGQGQREIRFLHTQRGYNYRMTNVEAAILLGQIERMGEIFELKEKVFEYYRDEFSKRDYAVLQKDEPNTINANWMFGIRIPGIKYSYIKYFLNIKEIDIRPMFYPITHHFHLVNVSCKKDVAQLLSNECFILPSYPELTREDQDYIIRSVDEYVRENNIL